MSRPRLGCHVRIGREYGVCMMHYSSTLATRYTRHCRIRAERIRRSTAAYALSGTIYGLQMKQEGIYLLFRSRTDSAAAAQWVRHISNDTLALMINRRRTRQLYRTGCLTVPDHCTSRLCHFREQGAWRWRWSPPWTLANRKQLHVSRSGRLFAQKPGKIGGYCWRRQ